MLDDALVHVGEVKGAIGAGAGIHGTEPFVGGGEELLFGRVESSGLGSEITVEGEPPDQVAARFGHEEVAVGIVRELVASVNAGAGHHGVGAQGSVVPQFQPAQGDLRGGTDGKNLLGLPRDMDVDAEAIAAAAGELPEAGIAAQVLLRDIVHERGAAFVAGVEPSQVVEAHSELAALDSVLLDQFSIA
ncbi:MAG: hypothetical protein GWO24_08205, partial [Akkermansiaceae bacterium]|nr:hypothetical protein [Akkermansiaceae bacterium]